MFNLLLVKELQALNYLQSILFGLIFFEATLFWKDIGKTGLQLFKVNAKELV